MNKTSRTNGLAFWLRSSDIRLPLTASSFLIDTALISVFVLKLFSSPALKILNAIKSGDGFLVDGVVVRARGLNQRRSTASLLGEKKVLAPPRCPERPHEARAFLLFSHPFRFERRRYMGTCTGKPVDSDRKNQTAAISSSFGP